MIEFDFTNNCSGCGACQNVCPFDAIEMSQNSEGFFIPSIDRDKCKKCGKCDKVCPHLNKDIITGEDKDIKATWLYSSTNEEVKLKSSSGAVCYELAQYIISIGGSVAGCVWDDKLVAKHEVGGTKDFVIRTQGSKYVQSYVGSVYKDTVEIIKSGKKVLFTGTPCQATAMHNYLVVNGLENYRDNLITLGVICHGVASPLVWESFKKYEENKKGTPLVGVNFRDKSKEGYKKSYCHYVFADGRSTYVPTFFPSSKYIEATLVYNLAIRNSCAHCDCKGVNKGIDLIVGDWYAENKGEGRLGTSCIVAFTDRGRLFAESTLKSLREFEYSSVLKDNSFIRDSIKESPNRKLFFEKIVDENYWDKVEELYPPKYKYKKFFIKIGLYDLIKKVIG